jgi:hypothetical protein
VVCLKQVPHELGEAGGYGGLGAVLVEFFEVGDGEILALGGFGFDLLFDDFAFGVVGGFSWHVPNYLWFWASICQFSGCDWMWVTGVAWVLGGCSSGRAGSVVFLLAVPGSGVFALRTLPSTGSKMMTSPQASSIFAFFLITLL